jgi:hypothetical protein
MPLNFPYPANLNDTFTLGGKTWIYNGYGWVLQGNRTGFTGSIGYTGSQGTTGFVGSKGDTGFVGSQGNLGYTGSKGDLGYTGSIGYTGSKGNSVAVNSQDTPPTSPNLGDIWVDSNGLQYFWIQDSNGSQWVQFSTNQAVQGYTGSSGIAARSTVSGTTSSLANNAHEFLTITGYKSYHLLKIQTSAAAWVTIYTDDASKYADENRPQTTDPLSGSGVIAEIITTGADTILITPSTLGFNNHNPVDTNIPTKVVNLSGSTTAITVTLTLVQIEI